MHAWCTCWISLVCTNDGSDHAISLKSIWQLVRVKEKKAHAHELEAAGFMNHVVFACSIKEYSNTFSFFSKQEDGFTACFPRDDGFLFGSAPVRSRQLSINLQHSVYSIYWSSFSFTWRRKVGKNIISLKLCKLSTWPVGACIHHV